MTNNVFKSVGFDRDWLFYIKPSTVRTAVMNSTCSCLMSISNVDKYVSIFIIKDGCLFKYYPLTTANKFLINVLVFLPSLLYYFQQTVT